MNATERGPHTQVKRVSFDLESIVRRIMLRRLLARRAASKTENTPQKSVESTQINNDDIDNGKTTAVEESPKKVEICYKDKNSDNTPDNKLVIEDVARKEQLINTEGEKAEDIALTKNTDTHLEESNKKIDRSLENEEEREKKDEEKEKESAAEEVDSSSESLPESEVESNAESCQSEFRSDAEEKDSGIEKGESPDLLCQDINKDQEAQNKLEESERKPENIQQDALISELKKSKIPVNTTLQVMSPSNSKAKRLVKRGKSGKRLTKKNSDFDSELSCDSSPEKMRRGRKNLTVSYLSYPQRFVRSSLAVEARLSQWHRETSVVEGRGSSRLESPARTRMLKQTAKNTTRNSMLCQRNDSLRASGKNVNFSDSRLSESSDTSSDEDAKRMSVRTIYSNKKALRKRIVNLEGMLLSMAIQKEGLENIVFIMNTWSLELSDVERTKLGVPYIRSVKQVLKKQRQSLSSKKSEFGQLMTLLSEAGVPCFDDVTKMIKQLNKDISSIVQDRKRYSSRHIEDIRQIQGKIIGTCSAITAVYYEE